MRTAIIGAGTLGLTLAHHLFQGGHQVTILESTATVGGLSAPFDYGDFLWDKFYHVILPSDCRLLNLFEKLGISGKLRWRTTKTGFLWKGRLLSMSNNWELMTFPALSLIDKARLAAGVLYCKKIRDHGGLDRLTAAEWLPRVFGRQVYDSLWDSLLRTKFGPLRNRVPATLLCAAIKRGYSARSVRNGREKMGCLRGGMKTLIEALTRSIANTGGGIQCNSEVVSIDDSAPPLVKIQTSDGRELSFDMVISTLPSALFRRIASKVSRLSPESASRPQFLGVICAVLVLRHQLTSYYVTNLIGDEYPFTGIIEATNVASPEDVGGHHLVFLPRYDVPDSAWFNYSDEAITNRFVSAMRRIWPEIRQNVIRSFVHRASFVQAIWPPGSAPQRAPVTNRAGNVVSINAELAGRDTLNNNAVVRLACEWAAKLKDGSLNSRPDVSNCHYQA